MLNNRTRSMKSLRFLAFGLCIGWVMPAFAQDAPSATPATDLSSLNTNAVIAVGGDTRHFTTVVPMIEADPQQQGTYWLRLHYYTFAPNDLDAYAIIRGSIGSMEKRVTALDLGDQPKATALMNLELGPDLGLRQFSVTWPNRKVCTMTNVVPVQLFKIQGSHAILKIHGNFPCDMPSDGPYHMDIDVDAQVFRVK